MLMKQKRSKNADMMDEISKMSDDELIQYKKELSTSKCWCVGFLYKKVESELKERGF